MDIKQIKELIQLLEKSGLNKLTVKDKGMEISLEKGHSDTHPVIRRESMVVMPVTETPIKAAPQIEEEVDPKDCIRSPMVGTFYRASKPTEPPFVNVGDTVEVGHVLCIIEAMKVMNEIKSTKKGRVTKIHTEDGHPVEYGQLLFVIV